MVNLENGCTVWFTGLSGAGKSTVSNIIEAELRKRNLRVEVLDGDVIRTHLSKGLGFSKADRDTNIRRIGWLCEVLSRNGVVAIAAAISPYHEIRDEVRGKVGRFVEVYVSAPIDVLAERDVGRGVDKVVGPRGLPAVVEDGRHVRHLGRGLRGAQDEIEHPRNSHGALRRGHGLGNRHSGRIERRSNVHDGLQVRRRSGRGRTASSAPRR